MNVIGDCRKRLGLIQADYGALIGVNGMTVSKWERSGKPPALTAERISRLLLKLRKYPRPDQLKEWIRIEGGQVALEKLIGGSRTARDPGRDPDGIGPGNGL